MAKQHRLLENTALPYITNASPLDRRPRFVAGNNVLTSTKGFAERRFGFATRTADTFDQNIARLYTWRRWGGAFFEMLNITGGGESVVYKREIGTDSTFQELHTDSSSTNRFDFVTANNHVFFGNGVDMMKYDGTDLTNWGITAPSAAVSIALGAGALTATVGYQYVICWENSSTGHLSSPSPVSALTVPSSQNVTITGNTTSDGQVDKVRVYRTTDGGSIFFEHPSSPVAYATWTASGLTDSSADTALGSTLAPLANYNNRPTAGRGFAFYAGRIWWVDDDTLYYTGFEEINNGVPEESAPPVNYYPFGEELTGCYALKNALLVFGINTIFVVTGDSLTTFHRDTLGMNAGCFHFPTICGTENTCAFLDASNTIRLTDGLTLQELSLPIRPDIASITHASAAMAFHDDGIRHWLVLMDGGASKLRVYDQDTQQWMPPWSLTGLQAIHSGSTAVGTKSLLLGRSKKPLIMDTSTYQDEGSSAAASATIGLIAVVPDDAIDQKNSVRRVIIERNSVALDTVNILTDEDPEGATFTSLTNTADPPYRTNGTNLVEKHYLTDSGPICRRAAFKFDWAAANSNFKLFSVDVETESLP